MKTSPLVLCALFAASKAAIETKPQIDNFANNLINQVNNIYPEPMIPREDVPSFSGVTKDLEEKQKNGTLNSDAFKTLCELANV